MAPVTSAWAALVVSQLRLLPRHRHFLSFGSGGQTPPPVPRHQQESTSRDNFQRNSYVLDPVISRPSGLYHCPMPSEDERTAVFQCGDFDKSALCRLASKPRGGNSCFCETAPIVACGSFNWTIQTSFYDGVEWMLRSPWIDDAIRSKEINLLLLTSETATLIY